MPDRGRLSLLDLERVQHVLWRPGFRNQILESISFGVYDRGAAVACMVYLAQGRVSEVFADLARFFFFFDPASPVLGIVTASPSGV